MSVSIKSFEVGSLTCHVIDDGVSTYATSDFLFASAVEASRNEAMQKLGEDPEAIRCSNTCLLIEASNDLILIDTGSGALAGDRHGRENLGKLFQGLEVLGVAPEDISIVLLTHLHSDHVWGCFGPADDAPVFSSARHVVHRAEWEGMHPSLIDDLKRLEPFGELAEDGDFVAPGIKLICAPGHSPGHCAVQITSGDAELLCVGDAVAHPLNLMYPEWTMAHEGSPRLAIASRKKLLEHAIGHNAWVHAFHMPFPSLGRVSATKTGFSWASL